MPRWTANDIPNQQGRIAIVTGANTGLGYETALALAKKNAHIILACRNRQKAQTSCEAIQHEAPDAQLEIIDLDLASLASIRTFAETFLAGHDRIDLLINNAGIMAIPRRETADGFEMQFGVNHLGHFALTGLLLETLIGTPGSRIVTVTSGASLYGHIDFDDLQHAQSYSRYEAYSQSKLANILFTFELQRRLEVAHAATAALTAHPGFALTNLQFNSAKESNAPVEGFLYRVFGPIFSQSVAMGALPQLYAATAPQAQGGEFYGPEFMYFRGYPAIAQTSAAARDIAAAKRLWDISEQLTGVRYEMLERKHV